MSDLEVLADMEEAGFTSADLMDAERHSVLGPSYFAGRRIVEAVTAGLEADAFLPIVKRASDELYDKLREAVEASIMFDTEANVQGAIRRMVDQTVQALLIGEQWALERYPLSQYHDGEAIRGAIFEQCRGRLESKRIEDLEAEVARLKGALEFRR